MTSAYLKDFNLYPTQQQAFEQAGENNFFYAHDKGEGGKKQYGSMDFKKFLKKYNKIEKIPSFYELIKKGSPRFEFYDIDKITEKKPLEVFNRFIQIYDGFINEYGIDRAPKKIYVTDSSKEGKVSIHIVNKNRIFSNEIVLRKWYENFKLYCETFFNEDGDVFDTSVQSANRCMRMIGSTKKGQNRPLKPAEWFHKEEEDKNNKSLFFITNISYCDTSSAAMIGEEEIGKMKFVITPDEKKSDDDFVEETFEIYKKENKNGDKSIDENEFLTLIKLIMESIKAQQHTLCDKTIKNKLGYQDFRNLIFSIVNYSLIKGFDYKKIINDNDIYLLYRHAADHPKENVLNTIYNSCEMNKNKTTNIYTIQSLKYWAKENEEYYNFFQVKKEENKVFPEIDMYDNNTFGSFSRKYEGKHISIKTEEGKKQLDDLIKDFCRVVAVVDDGTQTFYVKADKNNLKVLKSLIFASKIYIGKNLLGITDGKGLFNILDYVPKYDTIECIPFNGERIRKNVFNPFCGFEGKYMKNYDISKIDLLLNHIKNIICSGCDDHYEYILSWLASIIQEPTKKTGVCVLLQSQQGAGKGIFVNFLINHVFGHGASFATTGLNQVINHFNSHLEGKVFIEIDELQSGDSSAQSFHSSFETLKNLITEPNIAYEQKGQPSRNGKNYMNFFITTNNDFTVKIEEKDRRYYPLRVSGSKIGDFDYFDDLYKSLDQEAGNIFFSYLMDYKIKVNLKKIKMTNFKAEIIENCKSLPELFIDDINNGEITIDGYVDFCPLSIFYDHFATWCVKTGNKIISLQKMSKILHGKNSDLFIFKNIKKNKCRCIVLKK